MNSQQELLDAINTISQKQDKSYDTPAAVLRVDGDTVWVHIDGGADETPVRKTINCEQGQTVQVRISNGSAFLVGNESAPPTDDKTANVAHFVAEQADIKAVKAEETATEVKETVEVLEVEVDGKVDIGTSNIQHLSSTMYQNANGVNIYNDELAVGDSYAHIDGDSFDIKVCTTAGEIDDANDTMYASFGREVTVGSRTSGTVGQYSQVFGMACIASGEYAHAEGSRVTASGNYSHAEGASTTASGLYAHAEGEHTVASGKYSHAEGEYTTASKSFAHAEGESTVAGGFASHAQNNNTIANSDSQTAIGKFNVADDNAVYALIIGNGTSVNARSDALRVKWDGSVIDGSGNKISPTILESTTISASTTSYTFTDNAITADSVIDIYDTIFGFSPTGITVSSGSATITFPAQTSSHTIKLFVY